MISRAFFVAVLTTSLVATAPAGHVSSLQGRAMVDQGSGFTPVTIGTELRAGNRLLVSRGSTAQVSFDEGCEITIGAGEILTVAKDNPCEGLTLGRMGNRPHGWDASLSQADELKWTEIGMIVGGVAIAAVVIIGASQAGGNNDDKRNRQALKPAPKRWGGGGPSIALFEVRPQATQ